MSDHVLKEFVLTEWSNGYWSFTAEHEIHIGYPDALQACAAAMRFLDPNIPRGPSAPLDDMMEDIVEERRSKFKIVKDD